MITSILAPLFVFAVIVLVHEGGHFITAKLTGMKVEEFAIGFGPKLFSVKKGETLYSLRIIPLGGYNKIVGMMPGESTDPRAFSSRPAWARLLVISAGSLMNILLAFGIFSSVILAVGIQSFPNLPVVGAVITDSAAFRAGIQEGDKILSIGGTPVSQWMEIHTQFADKANRIIPVEIERKGQTKTVDVIPQQSEEGHAVIGIAPYLESRPAGLGEAFSLGADRCVYILQMVVWGIANAVTGAGPADVAGPIGVARMAGDMADAGGVQLFLFIAVLSLNLGFLNFLPIPLLDGGLFFLTLAETICRRQMPPKALYYVQMTGMALLLSLFLFATMKDISRIFQ